MKREKRLCLILILICFVSFGQNKPEELDELISDIKLKIHSDPMLVISVGDSLYSRNEADIEEKTEGLLLIADGMISLRNYPQALKYINLAEKMIPSDGFVAAKIKAESKRAYVYFQLNLYDEALKILEEIERKNNKIPDDISHYNNIGYVQTVRGLIYRNLMNCEMGMRYFKRALEAFEKSSLKISVNNRSVNYYNMGNCYLAMKDYESAKEQYLKAYHVTDVFKDDKSSLRFFAKKGLANIYMAKGEYEGAIEILNALYQEAEGIDDKVLLRSAASDLAESYLQMKDWKSYAFFEKKENQLEEYLKDFKKEAMAQALKGVDQYEHLSLSKEKEKVQYEIIGISIFFLLTFSLLVWRILKKKHNIHQTYERIFSS